MQLTDLTDTLQSIALIGLCISVISLIRNS